jgi:hypothetical protein
MWAQFSLQASNPTTSSAKDLEIAKKDSRFKSYTSRAGTHRSIDGKDDGGWPRRRRGT